MENGRLFRANKGVNRKHTSAKTHSYRSYVLFGRAVMLDILIRNGGFRQHLGSCFGLTGEETLGTVMV